MRQAGGTGVLGLYFELRQEVLEYWDCIVRLAGGTGVLGLYCDSGRRYWSTGIVLWDRQEVLEYWDCIM